KLAEEEVTLSDSTKRSLELNLTPGRHVLEIVALLNGRELASTELTVEVPEEVEPGEQAQPQQQSAPLQTSPSSTSHASAAPSISPSAPEESKGGIPIALLAPAASLPAAAALALALRRVRGAQRPEGPSPTPEETMVYGEETEVYDVEGAVIGPGLPPEAPPVSEPTLAPARLSPGSLVLEPMGLTLASARSVGARELGLEGEGRLEFLRLVDGSWSVRAVGVEAELNGASIAGVGAVRLSDGDVIRAWGAELRVRVR
ncbi:MAG: hypothetical protein QI223_09935, partial [Candidatus Korarchaeota archaeon]|nr:hypothetical protein [Candidatus Korarchaeota archaeon]